jgi:hypothetical protein
VFLSFVTKYNDKFANELIKHCPWVKRVERQGKVLAVHGTNCIRLATLVCDHYGASCKRMLGEASQRTRTTNSKKINCTVRLTSDYLKGDMVSVTYR